MKKSLICCLFVCMLIAPVVGAERLFDYRGVFPAERPANAKITNYMLLKKGSQISFEVEEPGKGVSSRIIIPRIKLTSDEKVLIEKAEGLKGLVVPETGIYEITLVPSAAEPGEMRFILKVFESSIPVAVASEVAVVPPPPLNEPLTPPVPAPAIASEPAVVSPAQAVVPDTSPKTASPAAGISNPDSFVPAPPMTTVPAETLTPLLTASVSSPVSTGVTNATETMTASAPLVTAMPEPVLLAPAPGSFLNPFSGFRFSLEDVNFLPAEKLKQMFQVFLRTTDGRELPVEGRRFSPEPDVLAFIPAKVIPGAVYNLAIFDESLTRRKLYKIAAFPELMVDFSMSGQDVKARIFWNRSIDLFPGPDGQVDQLTSCLLLVKKGDAKIASLELTESMQPLGSIDRISYRAQPCEIELTMPADLFADETCGIEVKARLDGSSEMAQVRYAFYKPVIEVEEPPEPVIEEQPASHSEAIREGDFSDAPAVDSESHPTVDAEVEEILPLENLPASTAFKLEKSFSVLVSEQEKLSAWPQDVAWGETGGLWVLDSQLRHVTRFNRDGNMVKTFGKKGDEAGNLGLPVAMAIKDNSIFLTDTTKRSIHVFNTDGSYKSVIASDPGVGGNIELPCGICFRKNEMWVADRNQARILCFNDQGAFLGSFGSTSAAPINAPVSIRADASSLFILESNGLVKKFSPMGSFDATFQSGCNETTGFDLDPWGGIWVCDPARFQVHRFARNGKVLLTLKAPPAPKPWLPTAVSVRKDGRVVVTDAQNKMLHIFVPVR